MSKLSRVHCDLLATVLSLDAGCLTPATTTSVAVEFVIPYDASSRGSSCADITLDDIYQRHILPTHTHRWSAIADMGTTIHHPPAHGHRHGTQGFERAYFRR